MTNIGLSSFNLQRSPIKTDCSFFHERGNQNTVAWFEIKRVISETVSGKYRKSFTRCRLCMKTIPPKPFCIS